jgi:serine protease AprX
MSMADRTLIRRTVASAAIILLTALPAAAQHRARLSADLHDAIATASPGVDVIVHGDKASADAAALRHGIKVKKYLKSGAVFHMTAGQLVEFQTDENYDHLSSDVPIRSSDVTTETIEANEVWAGTGPISKLTGNGVGVAVIDSGVDFNHAALKGRIAVSVDWTGGKGEDKFGHGTHVAATIAGRAGATTDTADYRGVASGANIINLRVLGADGSGMSSDVIEAIDWAIEHRAQYNIKVINLSLGAPVLQPYRDDPLCEATERAVSAGIVVVAAAGNFGHTKDGRTVMGGITSPGNDPNVLTVGALDPHATSDRSDDTVATYSSRGPTMYDLVIKPDLVAPGSHVVSAQAAGSYLVTTYPQVHVTGTGANAYMVLSGTSMAAAVASGAVALLLQERPSLSPGDVKVALEVSSTLMPGAGLLASGAGSLDALAAAEFVDGDFSRSIAESLGGELTFPAANFGRQNGVHTQLIANTLKPSSASLKGARRITFGTTTFRGQSVTWGKTVVGGKTFVWGRRNATTRRVVLGQDDNDTIIWGQDDNDTIIWGQDDNDTIIWGQDDNDTIIWGQDDNDTIIWGQTLAQ